VAVDLPNRRIFAAVLVATLVFGIGWQADRWLDVHVKKVQIEGELSSAEREAVMATIGEAIDASGAAGLHSLSLAQVQSAVSSLSWADRVSARRRWPDTLVVQLMPLTAVARWGGGGFVASNGEVISLSASNARTQLPLLNCEGANSARAMEVFNLLSRALNPADLRLIELNESLLGEWTAGIVERASASELSAEPMFVSLGADDLVPRLQRFLAVRARLIDEHKMAGGYSSPMTRVASIDARYHNGVAVRFVESAITDATQELLH